MESCEKDCTAFIVQFWENFVSNMVDMLGDYNVTEEKVHVRCHMKPVGRVETQT